MKTICRCAVLATLALLTAVSRADFPIVLPPIPTPEIEIWVAHPQATCPPGFANGEVSPGDSWAWVLDGAFREHMGASREPCWAGGPGTHPACRRAAWWEDLISV